MSLRPVPSHLRDPNNPPPGLLGKSLQHWIRNAKHALCNFYYQQEYPQFTIPSSHYRVLHINRFTDLSTYRSVIGHINGCTAFSIDTENNGDSQALALIQVHSIPVILPAIVLLVELNHLPSLDSPLFLQCCELFQSLFRENNFIYGWGPPRVELEKALPHRLFRIPLRCRCINLQKKFATWFGSQSSFGESCVSALSDSDLSVNEYCDDGHSFRYIHSAGLWSLQNAIRYVFNAFLDKSCTRSAWHRLLDPEHSSLTFHSRQAMIRYAIYDCLAVTALHYPTMHSWDVRRIRQTSLVDLLTQVKRCNSSMVYEHISHEDPISDTVPTNALDILSVIPAESRSSSIVQIRTDVQHTSQSGIASSHSRRSRESRQRRNQHRNQRRRTFRFMYHLTRKLYYRFTMHDIKTMLHNLRIRFVHVKAWQDTVVIGFKSALLRDSFDETIHPNLFDRAHYYSMSRTR
jgi:hypothetical protein